MVTLSPLGFNRSELTARYASPVLEEDAWHSYSGLQTLKIASRFLDDLKDKTTWLLNAGAGIYEVSAGRCREVSLDLFAGPIHGRLYPVCGSVEHLPFPDRTFACAVCVGEVLGYCDPAKAISELARTVQPDGTLICDFRNSRGFRHWFTRSFGRAADLVMDEYNAAPERAWIYDPRYIKSLLTSYGFDIRAEIGIHTWSAFARRCGAPISTALAVQRALERLPLPAAFADITTIVASRNGSAK